MEEGYIADLNVKTGDKIKSGDTVAEIETDKATLPLESYYSGIVLYLAAKKGDTLKIGDLIAIVGNDGEDFSTLLVENRVSKTEAIPLINTKSDDKSELVPEAPVANEVETDSISSGDERIKASPLARTIAKEKGIDLSRVTGTGEDGRITKRDLEKVASATIGNTSPFVGKESSRDVRVSQMRKTIAKRLSESKNGAPHFYITMDINMNNAVSMRTQLNNILPVKVSFNDLVIKAVALALRQNLNVNCSWLGDTIRYYDHIHIGMAVAVDDGLLVPVIKFTDGKTVQQISIESKALAEKAIAKKLLPQEMEGNTFTISNLGMFGVEEFTAIINPPDACILAVGAIRQEPTVVDGAIKIASKMKVTLSCDHRVVDGATGARFLQSLKNCLENAVSLLV